MLVGQIRGAAPIFLVFPRLGSTRDSLAAQRPQ